MKIMRFNEVMNCTGLRKSSIYKFMVAGTFPKSVPLGERAVGWLEDEIKEWITNRIKERNETVTQKRE